MFKPKKYYLIGIAGIGMTALAGLLKKKGHQVIGSDQSVYPPASEMLQSLKIKYFSPYQKENLKNNKLDKVVVGNALGRGNPEIEYLLSSNLPYQSLTDTLREEFIEGKKSIVITGTHGKTTTTSLVAWILENAKLNPTIFIGGLAKNFESTFKLGRGPFIVLEGDEYDTSFFDKKPKFWHYRPYIGLVNNIELDHIDIYHNFEDLKFAFLRFMNLIPPNGLLVLNNDDKNIKSILKKIKVKLPIKTFGLKNGDYYAKSIKFDRLKNQTSFEVFHNKKFLLNLNTNLVGDYNISNILAAVTIAQFLKIPLATIKKAVNSFEGVKRRSEIISQTNDITIISDYAHHPTAVLKTLKGLRSKFPKQRFLLVFEPGSASSKRRIFEKDYINSFKSADLVFLYKPFKIEALPKSERINLKTIVSELKRSKIWAKEFMELNELLNSLKHQTRKNDVIIIMSCRGFDDLFKKISGNTISTKKS